MNTPYSSCDNGGLLVLIKERDEAAFKELYQRYWYILYKHARKMLQDDEEAKDVVQDVFTKIWSHAAKMDINTNVSGYLYMMTRNKILNIFGQNRLQHLPLESFNDLIEHSENKTDHLLRERELAHLIEEEIARLPQKMRYVFELSRKNNLSHHEIAEKLDISDKTVKKQIVKAIKVLRPKLGSLFFLLSSFITSAAYAFLFY